MVRVEKYFEVLYVYKGGKVLERLQVPISFNGSICWSLKKIHVQKVSVVKMRM